MHRCVKAAATLAHRRWADRGFPCGYRVATAGATLNVLWQQFAGRVKGAIAAGASAVLVGIRSADDGVGPDYVTSVLTALQVSQSRARSQVVACPRVGCLLIPPCEWLATNYVPAAATRQVARPRVCVEPRSRAPAGAVHRGCEPMGTRVAAGRALGCETSHPGPVGSSNHARARSPTVPALDPRRLPWITLCPVCSPFKCS